jgi:hypothetical protein
MAFLWLKCPDIGTLQPVRAEKAHQRPRVLVTSAILGGAEARSHIAPKLLSLSIPCLFAHTAQDGRSWPSLTRPLEALPESVLGVVKRRQACYRLDYDHGRLRRPSRPHGHRRGQD